MSRRLLVVNADDFGLTPGVSKGILAAYETGLVTSTSVLAAAPAFPAWSAALRDSGLGAGVHLCAVGEDPPVLGAAEIPTLVDRHGRLAPSWRVFVARAAAGRIDPDDLRREFAAQVAAVRAAGVEPTHLDSHQYVHIWPSVTAVVAALCTVEGIPAARVAGTWSRTPRARVVASLARRARAALRSAGVVVAERSAGLDTAGHVDGAAFGRLLSWLARGAGHADVTVHPGVEHDPDRARYAWGYDWATELATLVDPRSAELVSRAGLVPGSMADLVRASV